MKQLIGVALVISGSSIGGFILAQRLRERCHLLNTWLRILDILQTEIYYQTKLLPEVFRRVAVLIPETELAGYFVEMAGRIEFGSDHELVQLWLEMITQTKPGILTSADLAILKDLGSYLGSTERQDQLAKINACKMSLQQNRQEAQTEQAKKTSLYRYLGFAIGSVLVLWLI